MLRSRSYVRLLVLAAIIGVPVSVVAYWYLYLVSYLQKEIFTDLPHGLGFSSEPVWWPLPVLAVGAVLVALAITYLPGRGGPSPAYGFKMHGPPTAAQLPGVILATLATLIFGMVLGPEMPLILLGGGLAALSVRLARRDVPDQAKAVVASAGSFAAISTLLGSPIVGAFLLMEASGLGGQMLSLVLLPGLLAAGVGSLIFIGLDAWTGHGVFSLAIQGAPHFARPDIAEFGWALVIGVAAALVGSGIRRSAPVVHRYAERWTLALLPLAGLAVAGLAIAFAEGTGKPASDVLFSGQDQLSPLVQNAASYTVGALLLLVVCKVAGVHRVAGLLPGRADLPGAVHRRGGRHRHVPPARAAADGGAGHGHGRDDRGHDDAAAYCGPAAGPSVPRQRAHAHPAGHRGGGGGARHRRAAGAGPGKAAAPVPAQRGGAPPAAGPAPAPAPQSPADP